MRLFIALDIDEELKAELERVSRPLKKASPYAMSLARAHQFHITVKFLGEVPEEKLDLFKAGLKDMAGKIKPFSFKIGPLSCFPKHGPLRLVWMVPQEEQQGSFLACREACMKSLEGLDEWNETVPYLPHITIARIQKDNRFQDQIRSAVEKISIDPLSQMIKSYSLYQSVRTLKGADHSLLHTEPFSGL